MMKGRKIREMGDSGMDRRNTAYILPYWEYRRNTAYINELGEMSREVSDGFYKDELKEGEEFLAIVGANLFRGIEAVGGYMIITNLRVLFRPHAFNIQKQPAEIPLNDIAEVGKRKTMRIESNGMFIRAKSGVEYGFVVKERERLIQLIQKNIEGV
jgi:hypothetical protein